MKADNFINIPYTIRNMDRYAVRTSVLAALKQNLHKFQGKLLDAGCGKMPYKSFILSNSSVHEYIGLDIEKAIIYDEVVKPDFTWNGVTMPFADQSFDCAFATEVLEHCPDPELFLREIHRVLKPGGLFFFTVPFLWNLHEIPHDEYRYTPFSLTRHLVNSRFGNIVIQPTGGWHASMAQMMGLWLRRSPMNRVIRTALGFLFYPIIHVLLRSDKKPDIFKSPAMITGMYGTATKASL